MCESVDRHQLRRDRDDSTVLCRCCAGDRHHAHHAVETRRLVSDRAVDVAGEDEYADIGSVRGDPKAVGVMMMVDQRLCSIIVELFVSF